MDSAHHDANGEPLLDMQEYLINATRPAPRRSEVASVPSVSTARSRKTRCPLLGARSWRVALW